MTKIDVLLCPPVAFLIILGVLVIFYILVDRFSPKPEKSKGKLSSYACGENMPGFKFQFGYSLFFIFALFFTVMHVAVLVIAMLPARAPEVYFGIFYLIAIFLCVCGLLIYRDNPEDTIIDGEEDD